MTGEHMSAQYPDGDPASTGRLGSKTLESSGGAGAVSRLQCRAGVPVAAAEKLVVNIPNTPAQPRLRRVAELGSSGRLL